MNRLLLSLFLCASLAACGNLGDSCELVDQPQPGGPTACTNTQALIAENSGDILPVRGAWVGQSHCSEVYVSFYATEAWCGWDEAGWAPPLASLYFVANGSGTYTAAGDDLTCERGPDGEILGIPEGQDPYGIEANRDGTSGGIGVVEIENDAQLDSPFTIGTVDVVFDDGTRLLADFAAPLCMTE